MTRNLSLGQLQETADKMYGAGVILLEQDGRSLIWSTEDPCLVVISRGITGAKWQKPSQFLRYLESYGPRQFGTPEEAESYRAFLRGEVR